MGPAQGVSSGHGSSSSLHPPSLNHRSPALNITGHGIVASPTDSEFSEVYDASEHIRSWDEKQVGEWLKSINCGQYEQLFRSNNFNGDNLLECDQAVLKDLGIKKVGDRVRIFVAIKTLRNKAYANQKKRNRDTLAALENAGPLPYTPSSSGSPRPIHSAKTHPTPPSSRRYSRKIDSSMMNYNPLSAVPHSVSSRASRPESPPVDPDTGRKGSRVPRHDSADSPRNQSQGYLGTSTSGTTGRRSSSPSGSRIARSAHVRQKSSIDGSLMSSLPPKLPVIRVIYAQGETKVVNIDGRKTSDEIIRSTLKKFGLREDHVKSYCFYILDGIEPDPGNCRRVYEPELLRICGDLTRAERNRLILRKIHTGEPGMDELQRAAQIAYEESHMILTSAVKNTSTRSQMKVERLTGETWEHLQSPISPASNLSNQSAGERERNVNTAAYDLERPHSRGSGTASSINRDYGKSKAPQKLRSFLGQRPPSELISSNLTAYFPDHEREDIEKTVRMSIRRSARLSRATSRLSVASNFSFASSLKDAPPIPSIADTWLYNANTSARTPRPLSISKLALPQTSYRDSIASSTLEPLQEESPDDNRKSYMSFDSTSEPNLAITDPDGTARLHSYYEDASIGTADTAFRPGALNHILSEDGEEQDEELTRFLAGESWENIKWMKGALIGQGSFGSVYLALHSITGELMAVKQVEMPSNAGSQMDNKKKAMVDALKREIGLLRELQHPNIVQYLGSSSDEDHLNIFLEYVPGGSVAALLNQYGPLQEPLIRNFVRQILTGLAYLHGREIIHRDIKGANVLVDNKGGIKISDFGISKRVEASSVLSSGARNRPSLQGSVFWMAPEVVKQTSYTRKADIWSLGCLIVEMFTGTHPYPDCSQLQAIFKIGNFQASPTIPENASADAIKFLGQTFELDHNKRPSADELLLSPFLNPIA
ncbi:MAG: ATP binding [Geoglossum umbratile]|nr:MAG: ATP binding [Geoglossum umbratile]